MSPRDKQNVQIAEFMGKEFFAYKENRSYDMPFKTYEECQEAIVRNKWYGYTPQHNWNMEFGRYSTSWGWLMPVLEKISNLELIDADNEKWTPYPRTFGIKNVETGEFMVRLNRFGLFQHQDLMEATFLAVSNFVDHYTTFLKP